MRTTRRVYRVNRRDINYLRTTVESYDGIAFVRTVDPNTAYIEIAISPGCETFIEGLLVSLAQEENLEIEEKAGD